MSDELAIARKARAAADEVADLRAENAKLVDQLDALRAQSSGLAEKPTPLADQKCYRCVAVYVDRKKRRVECQRCGAILDPIDVLHEFVVKERNFLSENEHAKRELEHLKREAATLKIDIAKSRTSRIECPRGCKKTVAVSYSHPHGVTPHDCYETRARRGLVPSSPEERWRVTTADGSMTAWTNLMTATRSATHHEGRVEEYTGPIGEKAERARDRVEHERQWREKMAASRKGGGS